MEHSDTLFALSVRYGGAWLLHLPSGRTGFDFCPCCYAAIRGSVCLLRFRKCMKRCCKMFRRSCRLGPYYVQGKTKENRTTVL